MDEPAAATTKAGERKSNSSSSTHYTLPNAQGTSNHGFLPSTLLHHNSDNERSASLTTTDPFLQVEVVSPPMHFWKSQPITPSPQAASSTLHDNNSSGWKVRSMSSHHDFYSEGKRIGYDGTTQTPSMQLLKPTASSLGHQVAKASRRTYEPTTPISPSTTVNNSHIFSMVDSSSNGLQFHNCASDILDVPFNYDGIQHHTKQMAYHGPHPSPMNPFGMLGKSTPTGTGSVTSEEDEGMMMMGHNMLPNGSSADATMEEGMKNHRPQGYNPSSRPGLHRRASWSQSSNNQHHPRKRGFSGSSRGDNLSICPERLRSCIIDPVASQLLRECAVHDDYEEHHFGAGSLLNYSTVSETDPSIGGEGDRASSCQSPISSFNKGSHFYASMPNLFSANPPTTRDGRDFSALPPTTKQCPASSANNYPLSPEPLFRSVSDRLLDVQTEDDIKSLARPVPRKLNVPTIASCCAPLPRRFGSLHCREP